MKVSIIVPIYNAAVFLPQTIQSIRQQSYQDLEIILVNDCSTDNSLTIINDAANKDNRIIVVNKKVNEGEDYARFSGLEKATGDYIAFLDADDWLTKDAVKNLLEISNTHNVDIVYANNIRVFSQKLKINRINTFDSRYTERTISGNEKDNLFISFFGVNIVPVTMWGNLYRRNLFTADLKRSGLKFGADLALGMQLYHKAKSIFVTSTPVLYYRWGGVTAKFQPNFINSVKALFERKLEFITRHNLTNEKRTAVIELANCLATHVTQLATYYPKNREENLKILEKEFQDATYDSFAKYTSDPYFQPNALNTACINLDYRNAYEIAYSDSRKIKSRVRLIIKKASSALLRHIKL